MLLVRLFFLRTSRPVMIDVYKRQVVVSYSTRPKVLKLQRWDASTGEYVEVTTTTPGHFQAPTVAGRYVYRVTGTWAFRGEIQDYFCLQVT